MPVSAVDAGSEPQKVQLGGDLVANGDTEHEAVQEVNAGEKILYEGVLDITPIQKQIKEIKANQGANFTDEYLANIGLSETESTFNAIINLPEQVKLPEKMEGKLTDNNLFVVESTTVDGKKVTVKMSLKNKGYKNFKELYDDVLSVPKKLRVTLSAVMAPTFKENKDAFTKTEEVENVEGNAKVKRSKYETKLNATGDVNGKFHSKVFNSVDFDFDWAAYQTEEGADFEVGPGVISHTAIVKDEAVAKTPIVKAEDKKVENKVVPAKKVVVYTVIPKTGDNNNIVLWAIILVAALATVIVVKKVYTNKR